MTSPHAQQLLRQLPSVSALLATDRVGAWLETDPRPLVTDCLRDAVEAMRSQILADAGGACGAMHVREDFVLDRAAELLEHRSRPSVVRAINATGVILHTGLGRAVWPERAVEDMIDGLKGYVTLAISRDTGQRSERHNRIEPLLCELTGAEAATVVNNNAAATLLVLAALGAGRETIVSRGQLIEIGGSFRLPEVMAASGSTMVEVGTTNRTHLRDYERAITDATAMLLRAHPSNYRVVGFTGEVAAGDLAELAHRHGLWMVDDLGAGALVDLERFDLPHEPTVQETLAAGADVVLFSTDKLIGGPQGGAIVGKRDAIERIRKHPLARALRVDKTCLMALERTLMLFRDEELLIREHPLYRALAVTPAQLAERAEALQAAIRAAAPSAEVAVADDAGYLGSGSLPMEALATKVVTLRAGSVEAGELARRLRRDEAAVFARVDAGRVIFDVRTLLAGEIDRVAAAAGRGLAE